MYSPLCLPVYSCVGARGAPARMPRRLLHVGVLYAG